MKNHIKQFGQFIGESNFRRDDPMTGASSEKSVNIIDLLDCYINTNHPNDRVLVQVDISNPSRDLIDGGIDLIVDPNDEQLGNAEWDSTFHSELYDSGRRISHEEYYDR